MPTPTPGTSPGRGRWQHQLGDGRLQCDLCPRGCRLRDGQRGFCFVRQRLGAVIELVSYGKTTGFCVDPIEKKPLHHFFPGSSVLSFGTLGCNLHCKFCQNWPTSRARLSERRLESATPAQIAEAARRAACRSVAFTYNDPVIFAEYAIDTAVECHARGIATVAVTAGYITPEARRDFFRVMDAANVDLKAYDAEFYRRLCSGRLDPVLDTLRYLVRETSVWVEITNLLVPGANDSPDAIDRLLAWVVRELGTEVPLHFSAFHPDYQLTDVGRTPSETCRRARSQALSHGLRYVYTGNLVDPGGQSTFCPACGRLVIERDGYTLGTWALEGDRCRHCDAVVGGRFAPGGPEAWGAKRKRVSVR